METFGALRVSIVLAPEMQEVENRIIERATALFFQYGIKSVTMDDMARDLGISKKTIYQFFKDKDEIVCRIAKNHMAQDENEIDRICQDAKDPIEELLHISRWIRKNLQAMHPAVLYDLRRYHPNAMKVFEEHKENCMRNSILQNLERGKKMGLYRKEVNTDIISKLRMSTAEIAFDQTLFPMRSYSLSEVQLQFFDHFMYGIVSDKGLDLLKSYLKKEPHS